MANLTQMKGKKGVIAVKRKKNSLLHEEQQKEGKAVGKKGMLLSPTLLTPTPFHQMHGWHGGKNKLMTKEKSLLHI
eukprot:15345219-Ditylum_brightwellii.AAC.2